MTKSRKAAVVEAAILPEEPVRNRYLNAEERCGLLEKEVRALRTDMEELRRLVLPLDPVTFADGTHEPG